MKALTDTRSMRFVVALYSALSLPAASPDSDDGSSSSTEKLRRTRGESSLSTWMAWRAAVARRCVGNGTSMELQSQTRKEYMAVVSGSLSRWRLVEFLLPRYTYMEQGKSASVAV